MQNIDWTTIEELIKSGLRLAEAIIKLVTSLGG